MPIKDHTASFVHMFLNSKQWDDFAPSILILSDRGQGKTCLEFIIDCLILAGNEERKVKIYKAPEKLLEEINKAFPKKFAERFSIIHDILDVEENDILGIDEAGTVADAKRALTKELREFISGLTYARHNHIPVICATSHPGILKHLNILSEIKIYKHMNFDFVKALVKEGDTFAKQYSRILQKLPVHKAIFRSNYRYFKDQSGEMIFEGGLILPKERFCPWFSDGISQNMQGFSMATERIRDMEAKMNLDEVVQELIGFFGTGSALRKGNRNALIRGYLLDTDPEKYQRLKPYINDIGDKAVYQLYLQQMNKIEMKKETFKENKTLEINILGDNFSDFLIDFYIKNFPNPLNTERTSISHDQAKEILKRWQAGVSYKTIEEELGLKYVVVFKFLSSLQGDLEHIAIPDNLRYYVAHELWVASLINGVRDGNPGAPDVWITNDNNIKIPIECKTRNGRKQKKYRFNKEDELTFSFNYCKENNIIYFPLFFRSVKYSQNDYLARVNIHDPFDVLIMDESEFLFTPEKFKKIINQTL